MLIGYNTKDIMLDLTPDQQQALIYLSGATHFRFPGGPDAANRYSFVESGGLTAPVKVKNDYGDRNNPFAFAGEFCQLLPPGASVAAVLNLNRHLQTNNANWYHSNIALLLKLQAGGANICLIELGNEVYNDKTITGIRTVSNMAKAAKRYASMAKMYMTILGKDFGVSFDQMSVCMAPEESNAFRKWNKVLRFELGENVAYSYHVYARPDNVTQESVDEMMLKRIGLPMPHMHITEASWQYKDGIKDDPEKVKLFHFLLKWSAERMGMESLYWFRLGHKDGNKYNHFRVV